MPRTGFRPEVDGFAFKNSWTLDATEVNQVRRLFQDTVSLTRTVLMFLPYNPLAWLVFRDLRGRLAAWIDQAVVGAYGLCGGMVFAALDYYNVGRDVPRGRGPNDQPTRDTFEGAALCDYLWRRLIDSLTLNAPIFLTWMAFLHVIPDQPIFRGGPHWLCKQSIRHWKTLKRHIDAGRPWPIGLVATTTDPTFNHQVLACGYEDPGDGTGTIYLYDMNCPGQERVITVTFGDQMLEAQEDCPVDDRGQLRGFFCERYSADPAPPVIAWP